MLGVAYNQQGQEEQLVGVLPVKCDEPGWGPRHQARHVYGFGLFAHYGAGIMLFSLLCVNGIFSVLSVNGFMSFLSLNSFGSVLSMNSVFSIGSTDSAFSIGCQGKMFEFCPWFNNTA